MIVVADASPLIALAQIDHLELLRRLYGIVEIPPAVHAEIIDSPALASGLPSWLVLQAVLDRSVVQELLLRLDQGEAEALALALERRALLLIDEHRGRGIARERGVDTTGVVGLLILARQQRLIPALRPALDALSLVKFWLSPGLINAALRQVGE